MPDIREISASEGFAPQSLVRATRFRQRWHQRRALHAGVPVAMSGLFVSVSAMALSWLLGYSLLSPVAVSVQIGCLGSIFLTWHRHDRGQFEWWPLYLGLWLSSVLMIGATGGVQSPFLDYYVVLYVILGLFTRPRSAFQWERPAAGDPPAAQCPPAPRPDRVLSHPLELVRGPCLTRSRTSCASLDRPPPAFRTSSRRERYEGRHSSQCLP
jgi:hypothetical protein